MSLNRVILSGNLTRDPELKATASGQSVLEFGLAVSDRVKDRASGEWVDKPNFFDVSVFGRRGEALASILAKGSKVALEGRLRWSSWETHEGQKRSRVEVIASEIELLSRAATPGQQDAPAQQTAAPVSWGDEDDIPF